MKQIIKTDCYDMFCCAADQCDFTCCKGWDILIDDDTANRWRQGEKIDHEKHMIKPEGKKKTGYMLNMGKEKSCPFLNENHLCSLVLRGDAALQPHTCDIYPRQINECNDTLEYSLSFGCPAVVDQMKDRTKKITFVSLQESSEVNATKMNSEIFASKERRDEVPHSILKIRDTMIFLFQRDGMSLEDKFTIIAYMLHDLLEDGNGNENTLRLYRNPEYLSVVLRGISEIEMNFADRLLEKNELFLDITQYYRKEVYYKDYLEPLTEYAENLQEDMEEEDYILALEECFKQFEANMKPYDMLLQNIFVSKIFGCCVSEDIETILESFQLLLVEYVMIRHAAFLTLLQSDEEVLEPATLFKVVRDSIIRYSRMIEYNLEGMQEFFASCFDDAIWDLGYLLLLLR